MDGPRSAAARVMSPHVFVTVPELPDVCGQCRLHDPKRSNRVHQMPHIPEQAEHFRRAGDAE